MRKCHYHHHQIQDHVNDRWAVQRCVCIHIGRNVSIVLKKNRQAELLDGLASASLAVCKATATDGA
jgi:hypothetical protein